MSRTARAASLRRSAVVVLAVALAGSVAACSGSGGVVSNPPTTPATTAVTRSVVTSTVPVGTGIPGLPVDVPALAVSTAPATVAQPQPAAGSCHAQGTSPFVLPDSRCTPGAVSGAVTSANLATTVCSTTWAATVPVAVSTVFYAEFKAAKAAYGYPAHGGGFVYGDVVPVQLGGSANDQRNAWPVTYVVQTQRSVLAARLTAHVCDGSLSLAAAQFLMARDFLNAYTQFVGPVAQATATRPAPGSLAVLGQTCSAGGAIEQDTAGGLAECGLNNGSLSWRSAD
jgi:hypothetical protein